MQAARQLGNKPQEATSHSKPLEERGAGVLERRERRRGAGERRLEGEDSDASSHETRESFDLSSASFECSTHMPPAPTHTQARRERGEREG
jgi:hypothetical protein